MLFSLIRKISSSQHTKDDMTEQAKDDGVDDKHEIKQQEDIDGTSYDPDADPRDPGSYYTFPHFVEDKQETETTQQSPGTPTQDQEATHQDPGTSARNSNCSSPTSASTRQTAQCTPIPKSTSPSSPGASDPASPPFWPISPVAKRVRSKPSTPNPSLPSPLQRRSTTTPQPTSPQLSRVQPSRRAIAMTNTQYKSPSSATKYHSSPAARSLRSISAAQSPTRRSQQQQQQKRLSAQSQGSPKRDSGKTG
ncbi:hypothetical protein KCU62_g5765, partial [Aureobasidium sp. EXF-3399]